MAEEGVTRRLLFFAYYFPPLGGAGSLRALSFVRRFPRLGWETVVIAPREGVFGRDESLPVDGFPGVRVVRTGTLEPAVLLRKLKGRPPAVGIPGGGEYVEETKVGRLGGALRKLARERLYFPDSCRGWVSFAVRAAANEHRSSPFAAVLSSSPPVSAHLAAWRFSEGHDLPWVADWRDPWTEYMPEDAPRAGEAKRLERCLVGQSAASIAATDGVGDILRDLGARAPVTTVRNGFESGADAYAGSGPASDGPFVVVYTGTLYAPAHQDPSSFFAAVRRVADGPGSPSIRLRFLGKVHPGALEAAKSAGVDGLLDCPGFVSQAECLKASAGARLLLMMTTNRTDTRGNIEVPAKTYEYLAARRPILALTDASGEAARILRGRSGVWVCGPRDVDGIERAIRAAMTMRDPVLPPWPDLAEFSREAQAARVAAVLHGVVSERTR